MFFFVLRFFIYDFDLQSKAEPEFVANMNAPLVRLKAPAMRKVKFLQV